MPSADVEAEQGVERTPLIITGLVSRKDSASLTRVLNVFIVSSAWMIVSSALIMLNKYIMVDLGFKYPMFVTGMGMGMSGFLAFICCHVLRVVEVRESMELRFWLYRVLPIGLLMAVTLWTGNEVYLHLTVAFIQMLKAFNPVITMVCLILAGLEFPTRQLVASVLVTALGTAAAAYGEVQMCLYGVVLMFTSETAESIRLVMTQFLLVGLNFHPIEGLMYLASTCCLWLFTGCLLMEVPDIRQAGAMEVVWANPGAFLCASMMGFAVNALAYWVIKLASSLTLKVLATAKNTLLVVCGVLFFQEVVTGMQGYGYIVSITGFVWYNWLKMSQLADTPSPAPAPLTPLNSTKASHGGALQQPSHHPSGGGAVEVLTSVQSSALGAHAVERRHHGRLDAGGGGGGGMGLAGGGGGSERKA